MAKKPVGLEPLKFNPFMSGEEIRNVFLGRENEERSRMLRLAKEFGVPEPVDWYQVALALARQHRPELQEQKPKGRKTKWNVRQWMILAGEVKRLELDGETRPSACKILAKQEPWKSFVEKKDGVHENDIAAALEQQLKTCKEKWALAVGGKAYLYHVETGKLEEWRDLLNSIARK